MRFMNERQCRDLLDGYVTSNCPILNVHIGSAYERIIVPYAKAWNSNLAQHMHSVLPRELRTMVYEYLWDDETFSEFKDGILETAGCACHCNEKPEACRCLENCSLPHFLNVDYVGKLTAIEMVETLYGSLQRRSIPVPVSKPENIERAICTGVFKANFYASSAIRGLEVQCKLDRYWRSRNPHSVIPEQGNHMIQFKLKSHCEMLLKVENKENFDLEFNFVQQNVRLSVLEDALEALSEVRSIFLAAGGTVRTFWTYRAGDETAMNLTDDFFKISRLEWRDLVLRFWFHVRTFLSIDTKQLTESAL